MHDAVAKMLSKYECESAGDYTHALREMMQEIALLKIGGHNTYFTCSTILAP